jgi:lysophospholipid acyltransferase (LPLAT)-like uncharacterized protein
MATERHFQNHGRRRQILVYWATMILRVWFATCRVTVVGRDVHERFILGKEKLVGGTWHRGAIFLVWFFRRVHPMVMFSRSRDGGLIADYAQNMGVQAVRGSSSRGGTAALRTMIRYLRRPGVRKVATVLDGPRGPRFVAQPGMVQLARNADVPFIPLAMSAAPAITLSRTWDRTLIPLPFSRVVVCYGQPLIIGPEVRGPRLEAKRREIEAILNRLRREADQRAGYQTD